jgi:hypothetical protein
MFLCPCAGEEMADATELVREGRRRREEEERRKRQLSQPLEPKKTKGNHNMYSVRKSAQNKAKSKKQK